MLRWIITTVCLLATVLMLAVTLTVPAFAATGPAILTVALAAATFFAWPKRRKQQQATGA